MAQDYQDVLRPFLGMEGRSGYRVVGDMVTVTDQNALNVNPAALSWIRKPAVSLDMSFDRISGVSRIESMIQQEANTKRTTLHSINALYPIPVYRGAWVWAFGIQPRHFFDRTQTYEAVNPYDSVAYRLTETEEGALYAFSLGTAVLVTRNLSVGGAVAYLFGENKWAGLREEQDPFDIYTFNFFSDSLAIEPEYSGWDIHLGAVLELSPDLYLGASVASPGFLKVLEYSSVRIYEQMDPFYGADSLSSYSQTIDYRLWGPWRLGLGASYRVDPIKLSIGYRFHGYSGISFTGEVYEFVGENEVNIASRIKAEISENLRNSNELFGSIEINHARLSVGAGFSMMDDPRKWVESDILRSDVGLGLHISDTFTLNLGLQYEYSLSNLDYVFTPVNGPELIRYIDVDVGLTKVIVGLRYSL